MPPSLNFPQLDFVKPSSGFHTVTWERVSACPKAINSYFSGGRAILLIKEASQEALHVDPTEYDIRQLNLMLLD